MRKALRLGTVTTTAFLGITAALAAQENLLVEINRITSSGVGEAIGKVAISPSKYGSSFQVSVKGLPSGQRGFHVHEKGDCSPGIKDGQMQAGIAAGEHYDPDHKKSHKGPEGMGHKGDLPALESKSEAIDQTVTAPHLKIAEIRGRSLMIHEGGDNYMDQPQNGGGKGRIACGVIPQ